MKKDPFDSLQKNPLKMPKAIEIVIFFLMLGLFWTFIQLSTIDTHVKNLERQMLYFVPKDDLVELVSAFKNEDLR